MSVDCYFMGEVGTDSNKTKPTYELNKVGMSNKYG